MRQKHKFNAKSCESDEIKFSSKAERSYYHKLKFLQQTGEVIFFLMQVPFRLPGQIVYRLDFMEFWAPIGDEPGNIIFTEVKGYMNPLAKLKISQCEELYNIHINIVS